MCPHACMHAQIQASMGEGHVNLVQARELLLTKTHLGLVMEFVKGGNLTGYVTEKWDTTGLRNGLFLTEDEARYIFKVHWDERGVGEGSVWGVKMEAG